jgi:hypothetical protein
MENLVRSVEGSGAGGATTFPCSLDPPHELKAPFPAVSPEQVIRLITAYRFVNVDPFTDVPTCLGRIGTARSGSGIYGFGGWINATRTKQRIETQGFTTSTLRRRI